MRLVLGRDMRLLGRQVVRLEIGVGRGGQHG